MSAVEIRMGSAALLGRASYGPERPVSCHLCGEGIDAHPLGDPGWRVLCDGDAVREPPPVEPDAPADAARGSS